MREILLLHEAGDEPTDLVEVLRGCKAHVARVPTDEQVLASLQRSLPDLLVVALDSRPPWDLIRTIKKEDATKGLPVLAFRATPTRDDKRRARRAGCDSYDGRPLDPERLAAKVAALLRRSRTTTLQPLPQPVETVPPARKARVMIVDDDAETRSTIGEMLRRSDYAVTALADGRKVMAALKKTHHDLMVLDLAMPKVSGLEVLFSVRERHSPEQLPVVILSGRTNAHDVVSALEVGANDFLTKPIELPILLARVQHHLRVRQRTRELVESAARYRLLAEHSTDMVTRQLPDGTWLYVSPASRNLLGYAPDQLIGRSAYDLIHPDDFDALALSFESVAGSPDLYSLRYRVRHQDGRWIWFETTMNAIRDTEGKVTEIQGSGRDITAQVERQARDTEVLMERFGRIAEFRSGETSGHIQRMSRSCAILGARAGLSSLHCEQFRLAATLHDFGNILIPMELLHRAGRLNRAEYEVIKSHTEMGWELLKDSGNTTLDLAATIAWTHHEHWDGSGYPRGRRAKGVAIEGRISLICDVFDMMTSHRPYRRALPVALVIKEMKRGRGSRFDPDLLDLFLSELEEIVNLRTLWPDAEDEQGSVDSEI